MRKFSSPESQKKRHELVIELHDCKAGEQIFATYDRPVISMLCSAKAYTEYVRDRHAPVVSDNSQRPDSLHEVFTVTSEGDRFLIVEPRDNGQPQPQVTVERRPIDSIIWNETHADNKIVRKLPTPHDAPMASTLGYWEQKVKHDFPPVWGCHICRSTLTRENARCALVTIVGELPRVEYVIPICQHCHNTANGKTFLAQSEALAKAPKA